MMAAMAPPMSIQTALSVGDPVKNLETSELKELVALTPMKHHSANQQGQRNDFVHRLIYRFFDRDIICDFFNALNLFGEIARTILLVS